MMIHGRPEMAHPRQDMTHTHQTAPTQFVEANGIRFAYRRFGKSGGVPLVFNQHFTGTMDHWDPAVTDGLAATREVILFNNAGSELLIKEDHAIPRGTVIVVGAEKDKVQEFTPKDETELGNILKSAIVK